MLKNVVERANDGSTAELASIDATVLDRAQMLIAREAETKAYCKEYGHLIPPYNGALNRHPITVETNCMRCYESIKYVINPEDTHRIRVKRSADGSITDISYR